MNLCEQRTYNFLIALICIFFAQRTVAQTAEKKFLVLPRSIFFTTSPQASLSPDTLSNGQLLAGVVQRDHYVKNLSFFCRQEWKWEKATRIPVRFRVGTLEQCNRLEGKP